MRVVDIINKKKNHIELSKDEIFYLLEKYQIGEIPDYQMSAFLMAVYFNGMSDEELFYFTERMYKSGDIISLIDKNDKFIVDKHSTGGVGDKLTLVLLPLFSYLGLCSLKLSGKGLGHTGGTIDKLESIRGFTFPKDIKELNDKVNKLGIGIMGYTDNIVPLDKKIYALRDVTGTVASIPLIASSIMSKKLAVQSDAIILDVKVGSGAFMKNIDEARELADAMIKIGKKFNRKMIAILTNMDQPLGENIGNALEVMEAIEVLKGNGPEDIRELICIITAWALVLSDKEKDHIKAFEKVENILDEGLALEFFNRFLKEYNGDIGIINNYELLNISKKVYDVKAEIGGYISHIDTEIIGNSAMLLGAGRAKKDDIIDYGVGIKILKKVSEKIEKGEVICKLYYNREDNLEEIIKNIQSAYKIQHNKVDKMRVVYEIKGEDFVGSK